MISFSFFLSFFLLSRDHAPCRKHRPTCWVEKRAVIQRERASGWVYTIRVWVYTRKSDVRDKKLCRTPLTADKVEGSAPVGCMQRRLIRGFSDQSTYYSVSIHATIYNYHDRPSTLDSIPTHIQRSSIVHWNEIFYTIWQSKTFIAVSMSIPTFRIFAILRKIKEKGTRMW